MPPPEKASEESPGSKELRGIQDVRRRKRVREAEEALEEEEEARRILEEQKTLGLANPKQKIKKASGKTSKEGDPKRNSKHQRESQLEELSPKPKKERMTVALELPKGHSNGCVMTLRRQLKRIVK